ncbi:ubiquitin-conjugating enzyme/RWD-like protein [Obelidium mucronatum]|nr:ubiquitin-conjugating enzyme/RWD-like protein [Obelidium mucronatum]
MSRPALLLERELYRIARADDNASPWGISADVVLNDIFDWQCIVLGPPDTPWEGAILKIKLTFSEDYNEVPPKVVFQTVPFHPNIDMHTGVPCIAFLDDPSAWDPNMSIFGMLLSLQNLLVHPNLENPVNLPAYEIFTQSPRLYEQLCRDCVVASRRIDVGLRPHSSSTSESYIQPNGNSTSDFSHQYQCLANDEEVAVITIPQTPSEVTKAPPKPKVARLSFEEYHAFWKNAATALPPEPTRIDSVKPTLMRLDGVTDNSRMTQTRFRDLVESQRYLWYGRFDKGKHKLEKMREVAARQASIKNAYTAVASVEVPQPGRADETQHATAHALPELPSQSAASQSSVTTATSLYSKGVLDIDKMKMGTSTTSRDGNSHNIKNSDENESDWEREAMELEQWANDL